MGGAQKEHYGIVGQAALNSLAIALGRYWKEPVKNAWLKIWTTVVSVLFPAEEAKADESVEAKPDKEAEKTVQEEDEEAERKKLEEDEKKKADADAKKKAAAAK